MSAPSGVTYMLAEIDRMRRDLDLEESVSTLAGRYLRQAVESDQIDVDSHDRLASAILHVTCRQSGAPVVLDDVVAVARPTVSRTDVTRKATQVTDALPIEIELRDAVAFTEQYCRELDLPEEEIEAVVEIAERMREQNVLVNNRVGTFAGAVIYAYARVEDLGLHQDDVAEVTNVTPVTIRNNYREAFDAMDRAIPRSANPPTTVSEGFSRLTDLSRSQVDRAREVLDAAAVEHGASVSEGGVAGGAFVVAGRRDGLITDAERVAETVGVGATTVEKHADRIAAALEEDDP